MIQTDSKDVTSETAKLSSKDFTSKQRNKVTRSKTHSGFTMKNEAGLKRQIEQGQEAMILPAVMINQECVKNSLVAREVSVCDDHFRNILSVSSSRIGLLTYTSYSVYNILTMTDYEDGFV
jgi:hypothetical protein